MNKLISLYGALVCLLVLSGSFAHWILQPNNFLYTKEPRGRWTHEELSNYKASGYKVKMNSACAKTVYEQLTSTATPAVAATPDYQRFLENRERDLEFVPEEVSYPSRFKWLSDQYITYNDPNLRSGLRFSFRNKCLYDKECLLSDSLDYLFVKLGIRYLLIPAQAEFLKNNCVENQKLFYRVDTGLNFGRSDMYYRNGALLWLKAPLNLATLMVLFSFLFLYLRKPQKK